MAGFAHDIAGGNGNLTVPSVQSPNFSVAEETGWAILKNGDAYFYNIVAEGSVTATTVIISGTGDGMFVYSGTPAVGNLIISVASTAGADSFGNSYPQGVNVTVGQLSGVAVTASELTVEQGPVLFYGNAELITTTYTAGESGNWTCPAGVTSLTSYLIGGGGAGSVYSQGGSGGGGAECAVQTFTVVPLATYAYSVGNAAQNTTFNGITAHAGASATTLAPGNGGTGSTAATHYSGGQGGQGDVYFDVGGGGGSSAGPAQPGNAGPYWGGGGDAVPGGGAGGAPGAAGSAPGGGGGGSASGSPMTGGGGQLQLVYTATNSSKLQLAIAATSGSDTFGNTWDGGLTSVGPITAEDGLTVAGGTTTAEDGLTVAGGTTTDTIDVTFSASMESASVTTTLTVNGTDLGSLVNTIVAALSGQATTTSGLADGTITGSSTTTGLPNGGIQGTSGGASAGTSHTHSAGGYSVSNGQHFHGGGSYAVTNGTHAHDLPTV